MEPARIASHPYQAVAAAIIDSIAAGDLRQGEKLPSVRQLAKDREVSPMTAQKALSHLAETGYAEVVAGLGYFVTVPPEADAAAVDPVQEIRRQLVEMQDAVADLAHRLERLEGVSDRS